MAKGQTSHSYPSRDLTRLKKKREKKIHVRYSEWIEGGKIEATSYLFNFIFDPLRPIGFSLVP